VSRETNPDGTALQDIAVGLYVVVEGLWEKIETTL